MNLRKHMEKVELDGLYLTACFDDKLLNIFCPSKVTPKQLAVALAETFVRKTTHRMIVKCTYQDHHIVIQSIRDTCEDESYYSDYINTPFYTFT